MHDASTKVLAVANLREFFRDELHGALEKQRLAVEDQTEHYVVNMLTLFARAEELHPAAANNPLASTLVPVADPAAPAGPVARAGPTTWSAWCTAIC